jgi:hypothetical protein
MLPPEFERELWQQAIYTAMGYQPNPEQEKIHQAHREGARFLLILGGERSGKSYTAALIALLKMQPPIYADGSFGQRKTLYWLIGPDYRQPRAEFQYIFDALNALNAVETYSMPLMDTQPWSLLTTWGAKVETKTSSDIAKIASFACDGILICEAHQQVYEVWLKSLGRVSQTRGWVILSGTIENGLPWYPDLYNRWKAPNDLGARSFSLPTWSNTKIFPGGRDDPEIKMLERETAPDIFQERYAAIPRKPSGAVLPEFDMEKHVKPLQLIEGIPVELAIDPGKNAYAILFLQRVGNIVHVLDRVYERGKIAQVVIPMVMKNPLWAHVPKMNEGSAGVIDIAAKQELATVSQLTLWRELAGVTLTTNYVPQAEGREVLRYFLRDHVIGVNEDGEEIIGPRIYFNAHMTNLKSNDGTALDVLAEPELWVWRPQSKTLARNEPTQPVDANNHAMKAISYYLWHHFGPVGTREDKKRVITRKRQGYWTTR